MSERPFGPEPSGSTDKDPLVAMLRNLGREAPPADPPLEEMWAAIEPVAFPPARRLGRTPTRVTRWLPLAAALVIGVGVGRWTQTPAPAQVSEGPTPSALASEIATAPFVGVTSDYLEQTTAFLLTVTSEMRSGRPLQQSVPQARDLLASTRLLLDSPGVTDPAFRTLLDDLELLLAQIVRIPTEAPSLPETNLIRDALAHREVLPRLQVMLADARYDY